MPVATPMRANMVKRDVYVRDGGRMYRIEAKREVGRRVEVLVEDCCERNANGDYARMWVPEMLLLTWTYVSGD